MPNMRSWQDLAEEVTPQSCCGAIPDTENPVLYPDCSPPVSTASTSQSLTCHMRARQRCAPNKIKGVWSLVQIMCINYTTCRRCHVDPSSLLPQNIGNKAGVRHWFILFLFVRTRVLAIWFPIIWHQQTTPREDDHPSKEDAVQTSIRPDGRRAGSHQWRRTRSILRGT